MIDVFRDFGVPPMFIADSVVAIVAQRLLRKVCTACQESYAADVTTLATLGLDLNPPEPVMLKRGRGCDECFHTGYRSRTGIFEIFVLDEEIRLAILEGKPRAHLMQLARSRGMRTMQEVAIKKILDGQTTPEEMNRVLLSY